MYHLPIYQCSQYFGQMIWLASIIRCFTISILLQIKVILSYVPTKFNQIWDIFIKIRYSKTRYYFSIFTLKYDEICIMICIKYRLKCIVIHIVSLIRNDIQPYLLLQLYNQYVKLHYRCYNISNVCIVL